MAHAMDISVLEQGGGAKLGTGGDGIDAPTLAELAAMLTWLDAFHRDKARAFAMDSGYRLWTEYEKVGDDNYVVRILNDKLSRQEVHQGDVTYHGRDGVTVPAPFAGRTLSWRLVLAVTLTDRETISVVNATDPDWLRHEAALTAQSVSVEHLLDGWLRGYVARQDAPGPQPGDLQYHPPPQQLSGELADATNVGRGTNQRMAWEKDGRRYEFDSQENALKVYQLSNGKWLYEAHFDGTVRKTTGDKSRRWGRP